MANNNTFYNLVVDNERTGAKKYMGVDLQAKGTDLHDATVVGDTVGRAQNIESTEKVGKGAILPFFLQITYGHSQLSIIGGECFFVVGGVRAFGGEALA